MSTIRRSPLWSDPRVKPPYGAAAVDWSHPLSAGLLACWLFNEGIGPAQSIAGSPRSIVLQNAATTWGPTEADIGLVSVATAGTTQGGILSPTLTIAAGAAFSVRIRFTNRGSDDWCSLLTVGNRGMVLVAAHVYWFSGDADGINGSLTPALGVVHDSLFTRVAAGSTALYVDGTPDGTNTGGGGAYGLDRIGNDQFSESFVGNHHTMQVWDRVLPADYALWLAAEPYAFLRPALRRRYFVAGAAAGSVVPRRLPLLGVGA